MAWPTSYYVVPATVTHAYRKLTSNLAHWERREHPPTDRSLKVINAFLSDRENDSAQHVSVIGERFFNRKLGEGVFLTHASVTLMKLIVTAIGAVCRGKGTKAGEAEVLS